MILIMGPSSWRVGPVPGHLSVTGIVGVIINDTKVSQLCWQADGGLEGSLTA